MVDTPANSYPNVDGIADVLLDTDELVAMRGAGGINPTGAGLAEYIARKLLVKNDTVKRTTAHGKNAWLTGQGTDGVFIGEDAGKQVFATAGGGAGGLFNAAGQTAVGKGAMAGPISHDFATSLGYLSMNEAEQGYCALAAGLRSLRKMKIAVYPVGVGCDVFIDAENINTGIGFGVKPGLYRLTINNSLLMGSGVGSGGGTINSAIVIGENSVDNNGSSVVNNVGQVIAIGRNTGRGLTGDVYGVVIGSGGMQLGTPCTSAFFAAIGRSVLASMTGGSGAAALGDSAGAGVLTANGTTNIGWLSDTGNNSTSTALGANSTCSGPNQVTLGSAGTTPRAYAALTVISDERDKILRDDIQIPGLEFLREVNWVGYQKNERELYVDLVPKTVKRKEKVTERVNIINAGGELDLVEVEIERMVDHEIWVKKEVRNDGSRSGTRVHFGALAQQVKAAADKIGFDFAGLQHAAFNNDKFDDAEVPAFDKHGFPLLNEDGSFVMVNATDETHPERGIDVWTLAYEAFIPIFGVAIMQMDARLSKVERVH